MTNAVNDHIVIKLCIIIYVNPFTTAGRKIWHWLWIFCQVNRKIILPGILANLLVWTFTYNNFGLVKFEFRRGREGLKCIYMRLVTIPAGGVRFLYLPEVERWNRFYCVFVPPISLSSWNVEPHLSDEPGQLEK